jgi:hypothetical protein
LRTRFGWRVTVTFAVALAALVLSGCGNAVLPSGGSPSAEASLAPAPSAAIQANDLRYTCGPFPFAQGLLTAGPGSDEQLGNPAAIALRTHLARKDVDINLPNAGWHLTGMDGQSAEFLNDMGDGRVMAVQVSSAGGSWKVEGWGECTPRVALAAGLGAAEWAFDPAQPKPDASTQVFDALVSELSCSGGRPADGRVVGPRIVESADTVLVVFATRPLPGGQDCPGVDPTRIRVDLGEPLGARKLLDGGRLPPGDPAQPMP